MDSHEQATRGAGAVIVALAIAVITITAGWASGTASGDHFAAATCAAPCREEGESRSALHGGEATSIAEVAGTSFSPQPTPTEPADFPYVSARSIAVVEGGCGALLFGRDQDRRMPPASLTKLMTAAVAIEQGDLDMLITNHVDAAALHEETGSTVMGLQPGMELSLLDLLYGLMLPSGNDAAITIADGVAGSEEEFVALMNAKVEALGLRNSHFTNPHGLDEDGLYSSAYDMAMLARYVMQNETLSTITAAISWQPRWDGPPIWNGNRFLTDYEGADGVKIGYTEESAQTIVASATRGGRRIIASLMYSQDRYTDAARTLDWAFAQPSACP